MKSKIIITTILTMFATVGIIYSSSWITNKVGDLNAISRNLVFGGTPQKLYGDGSSAIYADSNHSEYTEMIFRDKENKQYGRVYGSGDGAHFGLLDGDGNWSYLAAKDNYTSFRINNSEKMRILSNGNIQANKYCNFSGECIKPGENNSAEGTFCGYIELRRGVGPQEAIIRVKAKDIKCNSSMITYTYSFKTRLPDNYWIVGGRNIRDYTINIKCPKNYTPLLLWRESDIKPFTCVKNQNGNNTKTFKLQA